MALQDALGGVITYLPQSLENGAAIPAEADIPFGAPDVSSSKGRLQLGDRVSFVILSSQRWEGTRATQVHNLSTMLAHPAYTPASPISRKLEGLACRR